MKANDRTPAPQGKGEPDEKVARVRFGSYEFKKKGVSRFDLRDPYHLAVTLTWPQFLAALLAIYLLGPVRKLPNRLLIELNMGLQPY